MDNNKKIIASLYKSKALPRVTGSNPQILIAARELRKKETTAEKLLWSCLRNRKLNGIKFKRQHPMGRFVADFYCHNAGLIIELDGAIHLEKDQADRDKIRTEVINSLGISVLRFDNSQIRNNLANCLATIYEYASMLIKRESS